MFLLYTGSSLLATTGAVPRMTALRAFRYFPSLSPNRLRLMAPLPANAHSFGWVPCHFGTLTRGITYAYLTYGTVRTALPLSVTLYGSLLAIHSWHFPHLWGGRWVRCAMQYLGGRTAVHGSGWVVLLEERLPTAWGTGAGGAHQGSVPALEWVPECLR
jgi:hypothetical protein